ncbi:c-type cytochrome, partial [Reinekea blandensis]
MVTSAFAADIEAGKAKAATCAACHGQNGISMVPMYPNLAGQKAP